MDRDLIDRIRSAAYVPVDGGNLDVLAQRARRRRRWRVATQAALVGLVFLVVPVGIDQLRPEPVVEPAEAPAVPDYEASYVVNVLVPDTYTEDGKVVMPVTFPDGTTAEFVYPERLDLASLGARPYAVLELPSCCLGSVWLPEGGEAYFAEHSQLVDEFEGSDGQPVREWTSLPGYRGWPDAYLVFKFGHWHVSLAVVETSGGFLEDEGAVWARKFRGRVTEDGFLVLRAMPPLRFTQQDAPGPTWLQFGGAPKLPYLTATPRKSCISSGPRYSLGGRMKGVTVCKGDIQIGAYGSEDFVRGVGEDLEVRNVDFAERQG